MKARLICFFFALSLVWAMLDASFIPEQHTGTQSYKVQGRLFCGSAPAVNVRVKLVDDDFGPDPDDEMDSGYTDAQGNFVLSGDTTELTTIDPHLKIYHDCNDGIIVSFSLHFFREGKFLSGQEFWKCIYDPCQRRWKFELPNHYITSGRTPKKGLDIGVWNLEAKLPDESHDCIH